MSAAPPGVELEAGESLDAIGQLRIIQRRAGYRFSVDALLLADFAGRPRGRAVDLGTGSAVIPMLVAQRSPAVRFTAVELQEPLFRLASRNVELNGLAQRIELVHADLRQLRGTLPADSFDLALSNPPYIPCGAGYVNPAEEKAIARHELTCTVKALAETTHYLLREGGALKVIFPSPRLVELMTALSAVGLEPRRMRLVHPVATRIAKLVLLEAVKGAAPDLEVLPPLVLHDAAGDYTAEAKEILAGARPEEGPAAS